MRKYHGGWKPTTPRKPFSEKLIQFGVSVKGKHLREAKKEIELLIKKYR